MTPMDGPAQGNGAGEPGHPGQDAEAGPLEAGSLLALRGAFAGPGLLPSPSGSVRVGLQEMRQVFDPVAEMCCPFVAFWRNFSFQLTDCQVGREGGQASSGSGRGLWVKEGCWEEVVHEAMPLGGLHSPESVSSERMAGLWPQLWGAPPGREDGDGCDTSTGLAPRI